MNIVHLCDCMDHMKTLPDKHYDLAICDPPYGIGLDMMKNGAHGKKQKKKDYPCLHKMKSWNDNSPTAEYFEEVQRITKEQIIWGCNYYAQHISAVGRIYHDKQTGYEETKINFSHGDLASCSLQKRITIFRYRWSGNKQGDTINWDNKGIDARIHPTQKPVALYKWLLQNYAKPGQTIFDSHVGSGSIRIACHDMGFSFEGCELDPDYWKAQEERFQAHIKQDELFEKSELQESIFGGNA